MEQESPDGVLQELDHRTIGGIRARNVFAFILLIITSQGSSQFTAYFSSAVEFSPFQLEFQFLQTEHWALTTAQRTRDDFKVMVQINK